MLHVILPVKVTQKGSAKSVITGAEKIRVVFDCSAKFQGVSLNDCLMQGPDLTNSLVGVLTRFREDPVAFMGDVETMFYQVTVPPDQYDFLRFLWWPDGSLEAELQEYRKVVHVFGAASSPSIANFALKQTARDNEEQYGTLVADTTKELLCGRLSAFCKLRS